MATTFRLKTFLTQTNQRDYVPVSAPVTSSVSLAAALRRYIDLALEQAQYEYLEQDQEYYGEIPGFAGVYATSQTDEGCRRELKEVLGEWIALRLERGRSLPAISQSDA